MMTDKQQIEEMTKILNYNCKPYNTCSECQSMELCSAYINCKALYNAGYQQVEALERKIKVLERALQFACGIADCNWCIYAKECDTEVIGCAELILQKAEAEIEQEEQKND